ncbi:MAG: SUMF1/EgtB/PvdO family nonheme iron enzyme [Gammaproteobacteria bacterium]|nr:SUMF1/EgtB/PvdO family nonheme iron enzyme [Gammaproteobacteria bacterium]
MESDNIGGNSKSGSDASLRYRIFLASPGDVPLERELAREAITHISSERRFRGRVDIEIIAWDQPGAAVAMEAGLTPQEAIAQGLPKPDECDLAVIVLWSRIGTPLPSDFELKADGKPFLSGTEWEYLNALNGYKQSRRPSVWVYRRLGAPQFAADDPELNAKLDQWHKLETFFTTFTNPDSSLAGGVNRYQSPDDFRQQFEHHLRDRLDKLLEAQPAVDKGQSQRDAHSSSIWKRSPYPGLEAFTADQAPIFFGRGAEIDQLLQQFTDPKVRFVAVVGVSGSGKSSLVMAGLLPRVRTGIIGNSPWADLVIKPGTRGGNPHLALAFELKAELTISDQSEKEIARAIQADPGVALKHLANLLALRKPATELLLVVDQFEELFTQTMTDDRKAFIALLGSAVAHPDMRVIITLRADFYSRAIEEPTLARLLRRDRGTFPLDAPGISAIQQMIVRPAEAAGVELEEGLAQSLLDDAGAGPGAMPMIAFTLHQLYREQGASKYLCKAAYNTLGGVKGAVQSRAESILRGLPGNHDSLLPELFVHLVEVNEQEVATRRRAPQSLLRGDLKSVADALTEARLLVTGRGEEDQPTLEIAHETVLTGWERLHQWIRAHAELLRARRDLERAADEWDKSGRHRSGLRTGRLLQRYFSAAEPRSVTANAFLQACKRHRNMLRLGYGALGLLAVGVLGILYHVNDSDYPPALAARAMFVQLNIWPVDTPKMEKIPAGEFRMGDLSGEGQTDEQPVRTVRFANPFEIGKYEVTFDEYDLFAAATGRGKPNDQGWGRGRRPVINVSWEDAVAYTQWLSERTGENYRLPSEAEWEYAARAGTGTAHYWPDRSDAETDPACAYANVFDTKNRSHLKSIYTITWESFDCPDEFPFTAPVGQFAANDWQLHDMLGNVWEWNQDCYIDSYEGAPTDGSPRESTDGSGCSKRVLRGGSWDDVPQSVRSANRNRGTPDTRSDFIGFRLARTL